MAEQKVMVNPSVKIDLEASEHPEIAIYIEALNAFIAAKKALIDVASEDPAAEFMAKLNSNSSDYVIEFCNKARARIKVSKTAYMPLADQKRATFIEGTVMNSLLHLKLLTDKEKRDLLVLRGYIPETSEEVDYKTLQEGTTYDPET